MDLSEKKLESKTIYDGKILKLCVDDVELPDGKRSKREIVRHHGGAAVLLVDSGRVLLVKQFRYAYGKIIYEIPAGKLEKGENPTFAAKRELEEETGFIAETLVRMLELYPTPGYTDEIIRVYFAKDYRQAVAKPDAGEFLNCEFVPLDDVVKMIESGEICDAKTVAAVYKYIADKNR